MDKTPLIKLDNIHREYDLGKTKIKALNGITLNVERGKFVSLIGPSGCGKTTALNLIGCIDKPDKGRIIVDELNVLAMKDNDLTAFRGSSIGFIFQSFNLIPVLSVKENVSYPLMIQKNRTISSREVKERTNQILDAVGLGKWANHKPNELSGGQRQRVAIARALVIHPKLVIADEPTANLDSATSFTIMELMRHLQQKLSTTFIFATHDFRFLDYVDIIFEMEDGLIKGEKSKADLLQNKGSGA